jgi:hypothetical protein
MNSARPTTRLSKTPRSSRRSNAIDGRRLSGDPAQVELSEIAADTARDLQDDAQRQRALAERGNEE